MKNIYYTFILAVLLGACSREKEKSYDVKQHTDAAGYSYETVDNDPTGLRLYTLDNGLKVYLSKNQDEPKIQTLIAVRAGSKYDPKDNTGLAHYLEHMLFKGTDKLGTSDWEKESVLLDKISDLFEKHKAEQDPKKKEYIYKKIDELSNRASQLSIASEYDKAVSSIGATGTNAHTWYEETIYKNIIPSNALDKWLKLESDRFSKLVLRLFHTELETVYEEFNRSQDSDWSRWRQTLEKSLFPTHPYGQQPTIGLPDHLKNPSMKAIQKYFNTYYVPNNMAVILVGDIDFDKTIKSVDNYFGKLKKDKSLSHKETPKETPIKKTKKVEIFGPEAESITVAYRSKGIGSKDHKYLSLISSILNNGKAGIIDVNVNQKQLVQSGYFSSSFMNDYGFCYLTGTPKKGQNLEDVKSILMSQIDSLKQGKFEDWLIDAVVKNQKLSRIKKFQSRDLAFYYANEFISFQDWKSSLTFLDELEKITKKDLMAFAKDFFKGEDNAVVIYKRHGKPNLVKVKKPNITPVQLNGDKESDYLTQFKKIKTQPINPVFVDYKTSINHKKTSSDIDLDYVTNDKDDFASLNIILDMGSHNMKKLSLSLDYLNFLGTDQYTLEQLKKEFYKIAVNYDISCNSDMSYIQIYGLEETLDRGMELINQLIESANPDQEAYNKLVDRIIKGRENAKKSKWAIAKKLRSFAKYGEDSPERDIFSEKELRAIDPQELVDIIKSLKGYKQRFYYYGKDVNNALSVLNNRYPIVKPLKDYPPRKKYKEIETGGKVNFVNYDMVQANIELFAKKAPIGDPKEMAKTYLFNSYFGSGLSSIVFQEIREAKSLAYSAYGIYSIASEKGLSDSFSLSIGTQANKLKQAADAIKDLVTYDIPKNKAKFSEVKENVLKSFASKRTKKENIFWSYERIKKLGFSHNIQKDMYESLKFMTLDDLVAFFNNVIKNSSYTVSIVGNKNDIDLNQMKNFGKVKELDLDYLFNY